MKPELELLEDRITPTAVCDANPTYQAECTYLDNLIPQSAVTLTAVQSGNWSNPAVWGGRTPTANDVVYIPNGDTVTVDNTSAAALAVLNNGVLNFATHANTQLTVDTLVNGTDTNSPGNPQGELDMGTQANPIQAGYTAKLQFQQAPTAVRNAIFENGNDYDSLAGGLISMGTLNLWGSQVTPYVASTSPLTAGATSITLASAPVGWNVGDTLLFPGTSVTTAGPSAQDEQIQIASIHGNVVTLASPLQYTHTPAPDTQFEIADETRNVVLESAPGTPVSAQGHVMEMHNDAASIGYIDLLNLGRTNKAEPLDNGSPTTGPGLNEVGRYALHFHRDFWPGINSNDPPILVEGCYESGSPGWGYDNHSSDVDFEYDVAYDNFGAGFVTEAGNEIGTFNGCYSIGSTGVANGTNFGVASSRTKLADFGFTGSGFWMQSPGVVLTNNIAVDNQEGFVYYTQGLMYKDGLGSIAFWTAYAPYASAYGTPQPDNPTAVTFVQNIALNTFSGNTASYATDGLQLFFNLPVTDSIPAPVHSAVNDFTASDVQTGVDADYFTSHLTVQNSILIGTPGSTGRGVTTRVGGYVANLSVTNTTADGFAIGVFLPDRNGSDFVNGGFYDDQIAFYIPYEVFGVRQLQFSGSIAFGPDTKTEYYLAPFTPPDFQTPNNSYFAPSQILLPDGSELYYANQAANYVPFPKGGSLVPTQLIGLTNQQIGSEYGVAMEGEIAPADAVGEPWTNGLVGTAETPPVFYGLWRTSYQAPASQPYTLRYTEIANGVVSHYTYPTPIVLQLGWNAIIEIINVQKTTFFVYGN